MKYLSNNKKNNIIKTTKAAATLVTLATTILVVSASTPIAATLLQLAEGQRFSDTDADFAVERKLAPVVVSGDNIYIAWWTNKTENGNQEVMFRASNDAGATFSNKTNLSNTTDADSWRVEIAGEGDNVVVSWWETNQTSDIPVARVSNDGGQTFGPLLMLAANGTLGSGEAEEVP
jgi:hypothetical protein